MNVKVITRHAPFNYGSLLQSMATLKVLRKLGCETEIIDYVRPDEHGVNGVRTSLRQKPSWNSRMAKRMIYMGISLPEVLLAERKFSKMRSRHLAMTPRYSSHEELRSLKADLFLTGSDQVWGPMLNGERDDAYFLGFTDAPKAAFSASFGRTEFSPEARSHSQKLLSQYSSISVREDSAIELLRGMGISCKGHTLDPTLLLEREEWSNMAHQEKRRPYLLIYQLHKNPVLGEYAERCASKLGYDLLRVSPTLHQAKWKGRLIYLPDVERFLGLIQGASLMITDSFHGTCFAINFNRPFLEILPTNKTGTRNISLLRMTGLEERMVQNYNDLSILDRQIDYAPVNEILAREREKSIAILKDILKR